MTDITTSATDADGERRFWTLATVVLGSLAVLKGLHLPSSYTATQVQVNYSFGFVRRGLLGEALSTIGIPIHRYDVHVVVSAVLLATMVLLLALWVYRSRAMLVADGAACAVFFASFALTFLVYIIGYFDIPLIILSVLAVLPQGFGLRLLTVFVTGAVGMLIHEMYVITFLPVTLLSLVLPAFKAQRPVRPVLQLAGFLVVLVTLMAIALVVVRTPWTPEAVEQMKASILARVDFPIRADFFGFMTRSARDNLAMMMNIFLRSGFVPPELPTPTAFLQTQVWCLLLFGPAIAFFLWLSIRIIAVSLGHRRLASAVCAAATLAPLSAHLVALDFYRWYMLATFNAFMVMTLVHRHCLDKPIWSGAAGVGIRRVAIIVIVLNVASSNVGWFPAPQFHVALFPFAEHWDSFRAIVKNGLTRSTECDEPSPDIEIERLRVRVCLFPAR